MQPYQSISRVIMLSCLMGLPGCAGDSPTPPADTLTSSGPVNADEQPTSGEVQDRGVTPTLKKPDLTSPQVLTPIPMTPGVPPNPPAFGTLPGDFAIRAYLQNTPLTARDGGTIASTP